MGAPDASQGDGWQRPRDGEPGDAGLARAAAATCRRCSRGVRGAQTEPGGPKTGAAAEILELLQARGALFFDEIVNGTRRLRSDVERGLRELVAWGLVTADGFQGLRQLLGQGGAFGPASQQRIELQRRAASSPAAVPAGRWAARPRARAGPGRRRTSWRSRSRDVLLQRYGVLFRDLYTRESFTLPWRDVLRALRRLEARGLVRGGRFVSGPSG